ncbi:efflux RND transporter periplasmic adaptor subunit [uncultured Endozoicomonas sp.]|uniref:efflux RND transporter periplasmic adaptor subunit n=1 Tax=uncultured Endozoicomonas sp. TaxID=432652 RepID=UPI002618D361|nr:efflux RND transporter periplasmic adaptor subunit [uncultured Endozoicomonas sp.]
MKKLTLTLLACAVAFSAGMVSQRYLNSHSGMSHGTSHASMTTMAIGTGNKEPLYWVAPMDPNYRRDKPGKSPMGMDLVPVYEEPAGADEAPGTVVISSAVKNNLGVRSASATTQTLEPRINTVGLIGYNEDSLYQVNSRVEGWVENIQVSSRGEFVRKGSKLFDLYSPALVNAQEELLSALRSGNQSLIRASKERLESLDVPARTINKIVERRQIERTLSFYAPSDGYVSQLNTRDGGYINPSKTIIELASLDNVWVVADVFERQSQLVKPGQKATMTMEYLPGQEWQGMVDYVYPELDPQTRSLRVRLKFDNPNARLKPNMYSRIRINTDSFTALSVPHEALIRTGEQERVVKNLGGGKFRSVLVQTGRRVGDRVEVLRGLSENDKVVTSAQFLLDSESSITADLSRFEEPVSDTVWIEGILEQASSSALSITHAPVDEWGWPAMTMDFELSPSVDMTTFDQGQAIRFEVEKTAMGGYQILAVETLDQAPARLSGSGMNHEGMDHSGHDMSGMNHEGMDHSGHDMSGMNHESMDHSSHNMPETDHSKMGH